MSMYFLAFHGQIKLGIDKSKDPEGTYINCWIEANNIDQAEKIAKQKIGETNWGILSKEDSYEITREDYADDNDGLKYYEQALTDKWVVVFHTYSLDDKKNKTAHNI